MSAPPIAPRLQRGALVGADPMNPAASIIIFQYNPDSLSRRIETQESGDGADTREALRLKGPPKETISVEIELDATDQLETNTFPGAQLGLYPVISSLEMLLYPKMATVIANAVLSAVGIIEIVPPEAPLTLFVWGAKRVVPVRLTELTISEQAYDTSLNPIRANASLTLQVLTYQDLGIASVGGALFLAHQAIKEAMATVNGVMAAAQAASSGINVGL